MKALELACGHTWLPYIFKGEENPALSPMQRQAAERSLEKLQHDRLSHRLGDNYHPKRLHLERMYLYSIIFDFTANLPVFATGVQIFGRQSARVLSRYFVFPEYRTLSKSAEMLEKTDDFEALRHEVEVTTKDFPFLFLSREKSAKFFEKIRVSRPDIFSNWVVHPTKIELLFKENHQGIMYLNRGSRSAESYIQQDLLYTP